MVRPGKTIAQMWFSLYRDMLNLIPRTGNGNAEESPKLEFTWGSLFLQNWVMGASGYLKTSLGEEGGSVTIKMWCTHVYL